MDTEFNSEQSRYKDSRAQRGRRLGLTGPVLLIALGIMFLVGQFYPEWGVGKTWPVILIVIGIVRLIESAWANSTSPR